MTRTSDGQIRRSAAQIYEEFFVPALFGEWAPRVAEALAPNPRSTCLDVGCGTGVLTRELARRVSAARVVGLDRNEGMLAQARALLPDATWRQGHAEELPFESESFSSVGCQFALMFFADKKQALAEMWRVLRPGGRLAVAVWGPLSETPGYASMVDLLERLFGTAIASELRAPFSLGDVAELERLFVDAGLSGANVHTDIGQARFPSIREWVHTDIRGWTLADKIDNDQLRRLTREAETWLERHVVDGRVQFESPAHIVRLEKAALVAR